MKPCFLRNDKQKIFLDRNKLLTGRKFNSVKESSLLRDFFALNTEKSCWKFVQVVRDNEKQRIVTDTLRNSFSELNTNGKDIANNWNFEVSVLGEYFVK